MHLFFSELRYALRQLVQSPGFTLTVVFTLALGIGANSAIFSVMDAVLLRGLPVPNPQELVYLHLTNGQPDGASNTGNSNTSFSEPAFEDLRQDHRAFREVMAFVPLAIGKVAVRSGDTPEEAQGDMVSGNFFSGLGVALARGHGFTVSDEKSNSLDAVISYSYWTRRFARNPSVLGQTLFVKGVPFTIAGIAPEGFFGVEPGLSTDFWIPLQSRPELNAWGTPPENNTLYGSPKWWCLEAIARLAPGLTPQQAAAEANPHFQSVAYAGLAIPDPNAQKTALILAPARGINGMDTYSNYKTGVTVLMTLVGLVLVIACTNVAMLLVARKSARQREFSVRLALGASRWQIFRQLLLESVLLVTFGGLVGWVFAITATNALAVWAQIETGLAPNLRVVIFTFAICAVAALIFGIAPLYSALRAPVAGSLKASVSTSYRTRSSKWAGDAVMAAQMTFCFVLLVAASLLLRTLMNYQSTSLGIRSQGLIVFGLTPQKTTDAKQTLQFYRTLLDRLRTIPGVESVTYAENRIGSGWSDNNSAVIDGVKKSYSQAPLRSNNVGPDFFHTLGVPVISGRDISDHDTEAAPLVAVVNETFVRKLMPGMNPVGHQLGNQHRFTIVGVVKDSKYTSVDEDPMPMAYYPYTQTGGVLHLDVELRVGGSGLAMLPAIAHEVHALDPNLPLELPMTQQGVFEQSYSGSQMFSRLSAFFGILAAFLVAVGLYGTLAYRLARRTAEIGVRMALGASPLQILRMLVRETLLVTAAGLTLGLIIAFAASSTMESMLFGLKPRDPASFVAALLIVIVVSLVASFLPARRAASIAPVEALRIE